MLNVYVDENLKLFMLNLNKVLVEEIVKVIGVELGKCLVDCFSDGEI